MATSTPGFSHSLPEADALHYLRCYTSRATAFQDELRCVALALAECGGSDVAATSTNSDILLKAKSFSALGTYGGSSLGEAEVFSRHLEVIAKELYYFASSFPGKLPWNPTSALEILQAVEDVSNSTCVLQPTKTFSGPQLPCFRVHDELLRSAEIPIRRYVQADAWELRQNTMREFLTPARVTVAHKLVDVILASRTKVPPGVSSEEWAEQRRDEGPIEGFYQLLEDQRTFVHFGDGLVLHVWRTASEARRLVSTSQKVWQTIFEHCLHPYGTHIHALLFVKGLAVSFSLLPPLMPLARHLSCSGDPETSASTAVTKALGALIGGSRLCRGTATTTTFANLADPRLHVGADGRYYFMDPTAFGVSLDDLDSSAQDAAPTSAPLKLEWYHHCLLHGTSYKYSKADILEKLKTGPCTAAAESIVKSVVPKLFDMVKAQTVSNAMHITCANMRCLFLVYQLLERQQQQSGGASGPLSVAMEAVATEMICRTVKGLLRAEAAVDQRTECSGGGSAAVDVATERVNRFMSSCGRGDPALWESQIMAALRNKYIGCPPDFTVPFHAKYFKVLMFYLTPKYGAAYDVNTNRFSRTANAEKPTSSFFNVPEVVKLLSNKQHEEAGTMLALWWSSAEQLPLSTPLSWMERTLRMQRVCFLSVIMKHSGRSRFIDACIKQIVDAGQVSAGTSAAEPFGMHRVIVAQFQLAMLDSLTTARLLQHPLFSTMWNVLQSLLPRSSASLWDIDATEVSSGRCRCAAASLDTCHFVGYVLRLLYNSVAAPSDADGEAMQRLIALMDNAAALQCRKNAQLLTEQGASPSGTLSAPLDLVGGSSYPIDLSCNAQLLDDLSALSGAKRVQCVVLASLGRYCNPRAMNLSRMNPVPTIIAAYHRAAAGVWKDTSDESWGTLRTLRMGAAWSSARVAGLEGHTTTTDGVGLVKDLQASTATATGAGAVYNLPQATMAVIRCAHVAAAMQLALRGSKVTKSDQQHPQLSIENAVTCLARADAALSAAYPSENLQSFVSSDDAFGLDAMTAVRTTVRTEELSLACAVLVQCVFAPTQLWRLAVLLCEWMSFNSTLVPTDDTRAAIESLEHIASRAAFIQRLVRRVQQGGKAIAFGVGTPEWHRTMDAKRRTLERQAPVYAIGMEVFAGLVFARLKQDECFEEERMCRWQRTLDEEVQRSEMMTALRESLLAQDITVLQYAENTTRTLCYMEELGDAAFITLTAVEVHSTIDFAAIVAAAGSTSGLLTLLGNEQGCRLGVALEELQERLAGAYHVFFADRMLMELSVSRESSISQLAIAACRTVETSQRTALLVEECNALVDEPLRQWCEVQITWARSVWAEGSTSGAMGMLTQEEEQHRCSLENAFLAECAAELVGVWMSGFAAALWSAQFQLWSAGSGGAVISCLVVPLYQLMYDEWHHTAGVACAALCALAADSALRELFSAETCGRDTVALEWKSFACESIQQCAIGALLSLCAEEEACRLWLIAHADLISKVVKPEATTRERIASMAWLELQECWESFCINHCVLTQLAECAAAETLLRTAAIEGINFRRRQLFSRPFVLDSQASCAYVASAEVAHRMQLCADAAADVAAALAAARRRELLQMLALVETSKRQAIAVEAEHASCTAWSKAIADAFDTNLRLVATHEAAQRSSILAAERLAAPCLWAAAHEAYGLAVLAAAEQRFGMAALLAHWEALHRACIAERLRVSASSALLTLFRGILEDSFNTIIASREAARKVFSVHASESSLRRKTEIEEQNEWSKLVQLEKLMMSITCKTFVASHKSLTRPSERVFQSTKKLLKGSSSPLKTSQSSQSSFAQRSDVLSALLDNEQSNAIAEVQRFRLGALVGAEASARRHTEAAEVDALAALVSDWYKSGSAEEASATPSPALHTTVQRALSPPSAKELSVSPVKPSSFEVCESGTPRRSMRIAHVAHFCSPKVIATIAEEVVQREVLSNWEKQFWTVAKSDAEELLRTAREPLWSAYREWISFLPCAAAVFPADPPECFVTQGSKACAPIKRWAHDCRVCVGEALAAMDTLVRDQQRQYGLLMHREVLLRPGPSMQTAATRVRVMVGVSAALPQPIRGALPALPQRSAAGGTRQRDSSAAGASGAGAFEVANPLLPPVSIPSRKPLRNAEPRPPRIVRPEEDILLEEWERRRKRVPLTQLDDLAPAEVRLRMRLEEIEQLSLVDAVRATVFPPTGAAALLATILDQSNRAEHAPLGSMGSLTLPARNTCDPLMAGTAASPKPASLNPVDARGRKRQM